MRLAATAKELAAAGVLVNLGGHGQLQGLGPHWEMWGLVDGGWSNADALHAATQNGADYLGMGGEIGSLTPGKLAEMVVVAGDPLADIQDSDNVVYVLRSGTLYASDTLLAAWPASESENQPEVTRWWTQDGPQLPFTEFGCGHSH